MNWYWIVAIAIGGILVGAALAIFLLNRLFLYGMRGVI